VKVGLGTVQFGQDYGISNKEGRTSPAEVAKILEVAKEYHVNIIDTAALYGSSEEVLGKSLPHDHEFKVVTKTIRIDSDRITSAAADRLEGAFIASLEKLRCNAVYGLMFHNADDLLAEGGEMLMERLRTLKQNGRLTKIGASVYRADQIDNILSRFEIDLIQLPMNVIDQRLLKGGHLEALKSSGVEIHVRSAFLQGLLLMDPETLPEHFAPVRQHLRGYHNFLRGLGIGPVHAALGFLAAHDEIDVIVCGVNNHHQLIELCQAYGPLPGVDFSSFALDDDAILNPSQWRNV
jgi:aryl-alcohol dehydrogenase-like predicted oxidoreductase